MARTDSFPGSRRASRRCVASLLVSGLLVAPVACGPAADDGSDERYFAYRYTTRTDNASILNPYPPVQDTWDIPIQINDPVLHRAAVLAADTAALRQSASTNQVDYNAYRYRITRSVFSLTLYSRYQEPTFPTTGGERVRVVGVEGISTTEIQVLVCRYRSPGVFREDDEGNLVPIGSGAGPKSSLSRYRVELTKEENDSA